MKKAILYILGICLIFSMAEAKDDARDFDREVFYLRMYGLTECLAHHLESLDEKSKIRLARSIKDITYARNDYAKLLDEQSKKEILRYMNATFDSAPLDWIKSKETITRYDLCTIIFDTQEYKKEAQRIIQKNCKDCKTESKSLDSDIAEAKDDARDFDRKAFYLRMYGLAECLLRRTSRKKEDAEFGVNYPNAGDAWDYYAKLLDEQSKKEIFKYMINVTFDSAPSWDWIRSKGHIITYYDACTIILDTPEYKKEAQRIIKKNAKIVK